MGMRAGFALLAAVSVMLASSGAGPPARAEDNPATPQKPGEGILCRWTFTFIAQEVGKRCPGKQDAAFQAVIDESVALIDDYVMANGHIDRPGVTKFKRQQGTGRSIDALCTGDMPQVFDNMRAMGRATLLAETRKAIARAGPPTWGDCV